LSYANPMLFPEGHYFAWVVNVVILFHFEA